MTIHVGGDGMTAHQRIRDKPVNQQIAAFGEQILFKPHKTTAETRCELAGWLLVRCQHEDGGAHREQQRGSGVVPHHTEAKQRRTLEQ